jgi:hypothetical protein
MQAGDSAAEIRCKVVSPIRYKRELAVFGCWSASGGSWMFSVFAVEAVEETHLDG